MGSIINKQLYLTFINGKWLIENPLSTETLEAEGPSVDFFLGLVESIKNPGAFVKKIGLKESHEEIPFIGHSSIDLFRQRNKVISKHLDYTDQENTQKFDSNLMKSYEGVDSQPNIFKKDDSLEYINIPSPVFSPPSDPLSKVGYILFYNFACLREIKFYDHKAMLKTIPSLGARHPFEVYVEDSENIMGLGSGLFHYSVENHSLGKCLNEIKRSPSERWMSSVSFIVKVVVDRYQWRYRNSYHYEEIFYELGHLRENFKRTCSRLDLTYSEDQHNVSSNLSEFTIAKFTIKGL